MLNKHLLLAQNTSASNPPPNLSIPTNEAPSNLITDNPFVPQLKESIDQARNNLGPKSVANKPQVLQKYLQFRSIAIINKKKYFSIFNKRTNKSFWIHENETVENFRITNYNNINKAITISDGINTEIIPIIAANEIPLSVVSSTSQIDKQIAPPPKPGDKDNQNKDKPKPGPRIMVLPVKR